MLPLFHHPQLLWLLVALPPALWLRRVFRGPRIRHPDLSDLRDLVTWRTRLARLGEPGLQLGGALLLIVALAGPHWPDEKTRLAADGISIMLVVDVSGSMAEKDYLWEGEPLTRLAAVQRALSLFIQGGAIGEGRTFPGRANDRIGLVVFAARPETLSPLTSSHAALLRLLADQQPRRVPTEAPTNVGDALAWGLERLRAEEARRRVMILVSDGEQNVPAPALTPRQAGQLAAALGVPVYTIGLAVGVGNGEAGSNASETPGETSLKAVAKLTGGRYFPCRDLEGLLAISHEIDRRERESNPSHLYRRYHDGQPWLAGAVFLALVVVELLRLTWWQRIP